ncbi:MAG: L-histidine N(alpha)-methyltransferase [Vulcanococcus sp.]
MTSTLRRAADAQLELLDLHPAAADMRQLVIDGLRQEPKQLPAWFLYDAEGSRLFDQICEQPEYTLTKTETALLQAQATAMAAALGEGTLVEFGAGSARKVSPLLEALPNPAYVALDISSEHLADACRRLHQRHPQVPMVGICCDYSQLQQLPAHPLLEQQRRLGFFPGSSLGNFPQDEARALLRQFRHLLGPGSKLLIGIDQPKTVDRLEAAYNDAAGISERFALNLLHRLNRELGADFQVEQFQYRARWLAEASHIEMALISQRQQQVTLCGEIWSFAAGEALITETSHKYAPQAFLALAAEAGWQSEARWSDGADDLCLHLLKQAD